MSSAGAPATPDSKRHYATSATAAQAASESTADLDVLEASRAEREAFLAPGASTRPSSEHADAYADADASLLRPLTREIKAVADVQRGVGTSLSIQAGMYPQLHSNADVDAACAAAGASATAASAAAAPAARPLPSRKQPLVMPAENAFHRQFHARRRAMHVESIGAEAAAVPAVAAALDALSTAETIYERWRQEARKLPPTTTHSEWNAAQAPGSPLHALLAGAKLCVEALPTVSPTLPESVRVSLRHVADLLTGVTFNAHARVHARYCSWCCGTGVKLCNSHILPDALLSQYQCAFDDKLRFLAESAPSAAGATQPSSFTFRHHCVACDGLLGGSVERWFSESPLFPHWRERDFLLTLGAWQQSRTLLHDFAAYPYMLLLAFRLGFLHLSRFYGKLDAEPKPEWRMLDAIRAYLRICTSTPKGSCARLPVPGLQLALLPLPVWQACAYAGRDRLDKQLLVSLFTAAATSFLRSPSGGAMLAVSCHPFLIVVYDSCVHDSLAPLQPFSLRHVKGELHFRPQFLSETEAQDVVGTVLLAACASHSAEFFSKVAGLLRSWRGVQPVPPIITVAPLSSDSSGPTVTVIRAESRRRLDWEYLDVPKLHQLTSLFAELLRGDFPPAGAGADVLDGDFQSVFADESSLFVVPSVQLLVQRLRKQARREARQPPDPAQQCAALQLSVLLFNAFNVHHGWHCCVDSVFSDPSTHLYPRRRAPHVAAGREAMRYLRHLRTHAAYFLMARLFFFGYDTSLHGDAAVVAQYRHHRVAVQKKPDYLPSLFELVRMGVQKPRSEWWPQVPGDIAALSRAWKAQDRPEFAADFGVDWKFSAMGAFTSSLLGFAESGLAPLIAADFITSTPRSLELWVECSSARCARHELMPLGDAKACRSCLSCFFCSDRCEAEYRPQHASICACD